MKCHLCNSELISDTGPLWDVGGRQRVALRCRDNFCRSIRIDQRSEIEIIFPEKEIVQYVLLVGSNERWYKISARKNYQDPSDTAIFNVRLNSSYSTYTTYPDDLIINIPRFYPIYFDDDLKVKADRIFTKLKTFLIFS